jgi:hypothetical protein
METEKSSDLMEKGDENTKFFQAYSKGRKLTNMIWSMKNNQG